MKKKIIFLTSMLFISFFSIKAVHADLDSPTAKKVIGGFQEVVKTGYGEENYDITTAESTLNEKIAAVIKFVLSFVGVILLIVIIYGGFQWLTAGGNDEQVSQARKWLVNGIIGMVIISAAYFITDLVIEIISGSN